MSGASPLKAIRQKCLQCSAGSMHEVRLCSVAGYALYDFRFGHKLKKGGKNGGFEDESEMGKESITETI